MFKKRFIAIIPARGGSKGLPGKNIKPLNGTPLVGWPIKAALNSKYIDKVICTTDDEGIARIAKSFGAEVPFMRPKEYAQDTSPSSDAIVHALNFVNERDGIYDFFVLLEPTSPLTTTDDIDKAIEKLITCDADSIAGVSDAKSRHPEFCVSKKENGYIVPYIRENFSSPIRRQELEEVYFLDGSLYISKVKRYLQDKTFYHEALIPYVVPAWKAVEIDTLLDFIIVEAVLNNQDILVGEVT